MAYNFNQYFRINVIVEPAKKSTYSVEENENVVYLGDDKPVVIKPSQRSRGNSQSKAKQESNQRSMGEYIFAIFVCTMFKHG